MRWDGMGWGGPGLLYSNKAKGRESSTRQNAENSDFFAEHSWRVPLPIGYTSLFIWGLFFTWGCRKVSEFRKSVWKSARRPSKARRIVVFRFRTRQSAEYRSSNGGEGRVFQFSALCLVLVSSQESRKNEATRGVSIFLLFWAPLLLEILDSKNEGGRRSLV